LTILGRAAVPILVFLAALCFLPGPIGAVSAQRRSRTRTRKPKTPPAPKVDYTKFSHMTHVVTQKLACNSCHKVPSKNWNVVRKADAAFADVTDFPEHSSCLECHRTQFFARERPAPAICSNCHIAVTPRDTARWLFPSLGDLTDPNLKRRGLVSEFGVGFPHDKHVDVVSRNAPERNRPLFVNAWLSVRTASDSDRISAKLKTTIPPSDYEWHDPVATARGSETSQKSAIPASCLVCHQTYQPQAQSSEEYVTKPPKDIGDNFWLKKGTFKTIPSSHTICFSCHSADSGIAPEPKNCEVCHTLEPPKPAKVDFDAALASSMGADATMLARWSRRISAGGFRHEGGEHPDLNCLNCHKVDASTFSTVHFSTMKVPVKSCGGADGCHITATTDEGGILNFEIDSKKKDPNFTCTKCHVTFGKGSIPESHPQAIPTPKPKK
jgi:hypothetical protein